MVAYVDSIRTNLFTLNKIVNKLELEYISQLLGLDIMKFQDKNQDKPFLNNILKKVNKQISEL